MSQTGLIFDLQRCSLRDGPGIRTTVFLKGCPLRCLWCHNPEALSPRPQISFNRENCVGCFACVEVCSHGAQQKLDGQHVLDHARCHVCGACLSACLHDGLKLIGEEWTVDRVLAEVERDRAYYDRSGGGLTLSGGEPMAQFEFTCALLRAAKSRGIHTCVETCGMAPTHRYAAILPDVDVFLFDYKETDSIRHEELTGAGNELIRANLDLLLANGAKVILRCPLVSGINDSEEHLAGIAGLSGRYPQLVGIEIMAYHAMGKNKAPRIGRSIPLPGQPTTEEQVKQRWLGRLRELGCDRATIDS